MSVSLAQLLETDDPYIEVFSYDGSGNILYKGTAVPGSLTSSAVWAIQKFVYTSGNLTAIQWAGGNTLLANIWDNATSLTYS